MARIRAADAELDSWSRWGPDAHVAFIDSKRVAKYNRTYYSVVGDALHRRAPLIRLFSRLSYVRSNEELAQ